MRPATLLATLALFGCGARTELRRATVPRGDAGGVAQPDGAGPDAPAPLRTMIVLLDRCSGSEQVAVRIDPDTGERTELFRPPTDYAAGPNGLVASPDGRRFAWAAAASAPPRNWRIYVQDGPSGPIRAVEWTGATEPTDFEQPAWSPDATRFAVAASHAGIRMLVVAPSAGGVLASGVLDNATSVPAWSPDGTWIAGIQDRPDARSYGVYTADVASHVVNLLAVTSYRTAVAFAPDRTLAYVEDGPAGADLVFRDVAAGTEARRFALPAEVLGGESGVDGLAAEPNGRRMVVQVRSRLWLLDRATAGWRPLYAPGGCTLVHNGLSWVARPSE